MLLPATRRLVAVGRSVTTSTLPVPSDLRPVMTGLCPVLRALLPVAGGLGPVEARPVSLAAASLKSMCSRKCAKPASLGFSSALPVFTHQ